MPITFEGTITSVFKDKKPQNRRKNQVFSYFFLLDDGRIWIRIQVRTKIMTNLDLLGSKMIRTHSQVRQPIALKSAVNRIFLPCFNMRFPSTNLKSSEKNKKKQRKLGIHLQLQINSDKRQDNIEDLFWLLSVSQLITCFRDKFLL